MHSHFVGFVMSRFNYLADPIFSKGHNSGKEHNSDKKKNKNKLLFREESIIEISKLLRARFIWHASKSVTNGISYGITDVQP